MSVEVVPATEIMTCGFGQCADPIVGAVMVRWSEPYMSPMDRRPGVVYLCSRHWNSAPVDWEPRP